MPPAGGPRGHHSSGVCGQIRGCSPHRRQMPPRRTAPWAAAAVPTSSRAAPAHRAGGPEGSHEFRSLPCSTHGQCTDGSPEVKTTEPEDPGPSVFMNKSLSPTNHLLHPPCFMDAETEAQRRRVSWPQFHTKQGTEKPTHRQEHHAVHPKGGVSGVER